MPTRLANLLAPTARLNLHLLALTLSCALSLCLSRPMTVPCRLTLVTSWSLPLLTASQQHDMNMGMDRD